MSLWTKDLNQITGADVVAFCDLQEKEGLRLDYKKEIPKKLANIVAAFANTRGGLVLLGVNADKTNNQPERPLVGMTKEAGIEEKITSMCQSKIYPTVGFEVSPVLENPANPGTGLVVIRVPESPEAPHAIDGHVYERIRSQNDRHEFFEHADIENVRHLLERRGSTERIREGEIQKEIRRALVQRGPSRMELREMVRQLGHSPEEFDVPLLPLIWFSVIPLYPWRDVCTPTACFQSLVMPGVYAGARVQRVPGGAHGVMFHQASLPRQVPMGYSSASRLGHVFDAKLPLEPGFNLQMKSDQFPHDPSVCRFLNFSSTLEFAKEALARAKFFFERMPVDRPGYLQLSLGILDAFRFRMYDTRNLVEHLRTSGAPFIDQDFRVQVTVPYAQFRDEPLEASASLLADLEFGFDRPTAPSE